jgi:amino acid transporter
MTMISVLIFLVFLITALTALGVTIFRAISRRRNPNYRKSTAKPATLVIVSLVAMVVSGSFMPASKSKPPLFTNVGKMEKIVAKYRKLWKRNTNSMQDTPLRDARGKALCALHLGNSITVRGVITDIGTNAVFGKTNMGSAHLTIRISKHIQLTTFGSGDSPKPGQSVYRQMEKLQKGQHVIAIGNFIPSKTDCFAETSVTPDGDMTNPVFSFQLFGILKDN